MPHFHAVYGEYKVTVESNLARFEASSHRGPFVWCLNGRSFTGKELFEDWERARRRQPLERIPPLE